MNNLHEQLQHIKNQENKYKTKDLPVLTLVEVEFKEKIIQLFQKYLYVDKNPVGFADD